MGVEMYWLGVCDVLKCAYVEMRRCIGGASAVHWRCVGGASSSVSVVGQSINAPMLAPLTSVNGSDVRFFFLGRNEVTHRYYATIVLLLPTCVGLRRKGKSSNYFRRTILHRSSSE